jgi:hypothetical protein
MKKATLTIEESLKQIKLNMNYELGKSLNEQFQENTSWTGGQPLSPTAATMAAPPVAQEIGDPYVNTMVRRLNRNYSRIEAIMNGLNSYTYKGRPALEGIKAAYKAKYGKDLPNQTTAGGPTVSKTPPVGSDPNERTDPGAAITTGKPTAPAQGYKPVTGTIEDPYRFGTSGTGIKTVQGYLGLVQDSKFGPKTQAALAPFGIKTFSNENLPQIVAQIQGKNTTTPPTATTSNITPNVVPGQSAGTQNLSANND